MDLTLFYWKLLECGGEGSQQVSQCFPFLLLFGILRRTLKQHSEQVDDGGVGGVGSAQICELLRSWGG